MTELRKLIYNSLVYIVEPSIKGKDLDKIVEEIVKDIRELVPPEKEIERRIKQYGIIHIDLRGKSYIREDLIAKAIRADMLKRLEG